MVKEFYEFSKKVSLLGVTPTEAYVLLCIGRGEETELKTSLVLKNLKSRQFLDEGGLLTLEGIALVNDKGLPELLKRSLQGSLEWLSQELRTAYPKISLYGKSARCSETDVINKLKEFNKVYKAEGFTYQEMIEATGKYVARSEENGWKYMRLLKYFILKDGESTLADVITSLREGTFEELDVFKGDKIV